MDQHAGAREVPPWDYDELRRPAGKTHMLRFLPYLPDDEIKAAIGYVPPPRGYGYGRWEEYFSTEDEARTRMMYLIGSGAIEDIKLFREAGPNAGISVVLLDEWRERREPQEGGDT